MSYYLYECCICFDKMIEHHRCVQCGMKICINCVYVLRKYEGKKTTFVGLNMAYCSPKCADDRMYNDYGYNTRYTVLSDVLSNDKYIYMPSLH